jgi:hypothetical protein
MAFFGRCATTPFQLVAADPLTSTGSLVESSGPGPGVNE